MPRLVAALLQAGEHGVDAVERPFGLGGEPGEDDVLFDAEAAEDAPVLMHELHAEAGDAVGPLGDQLDAVEPDAARAPRDDAHQALEGRALARAVPADERHRLVFLDPERDVEQDVAVAVIGVESVDFEQAHAASP